MFVEQFNMLTCDCKYTSTNIHAKTVSYIYMTVSVLWIQAVLLPYKII